jgi:hypothetical protein
MLVVVGRRFPLSLLAAEKRHAVRRQGSRGENVRGERPPLSVGLLGSRNM